eukprot:4938776-Amphidinium_carterae.3
MVHCVFAGGHVARAHPASCAHGTCQEHCRMSMAFALAFASDARLIGCRRLCLRLVVKKSQIVRALLRGEQHAPIFGPQRCPELCTTSSALWLS